MNKKKKEPVFINPFTDASQEESLKRWDIVRADYVSNKGSKVKLVQTDYGGGYSKLVLTETVYLKSTDSRGKLSDVLELKPQEQIRREKYLVFDISTDKKGILRMTKKDNPEKTAEFNKNEARVILYFSNLNTVVLEKAPKDLDFIYKTPASLRQTIIKINREFLRVFELPDDHGKKLIEGESRKNYWFNRYVRLNPVSKID